MMQAWFEQELFPNTKNMSAERRTHSFFTIHSSLFLLLISMESMR